MLPLADVMQCFMVETQEASIQAYKWISHPTNTPRNLSQGCQDASLEVSNLEKDNADKVRLTQAVLLCTSLLHKLFLHTSEAAFESNVNSIYTL